MTRLFVDREAVVDEVTALLDGADRAGPGAGGGPVVVVLWGPSGVGKTATALRLAAAFGDRFEEAQLYQPLRGASPDTAVSPADALVHLLRDLGAHREWIGTDQETLERQFRSLTAGRRVLTVLDDALSAAQVRPLLTASPSSLTIVTSRHHLGRLVAEHGAHGLRLGPLGTRDAVGLLARMGGAGAGVEAVARRCGGMPLALCAVGARAAARQEPDWELLEREMAESERRVVRSMTDEAERGRDAPEEGGHGSGRDAPEGAGSGRGVLDVAVLAASYEELPETVARVYRLSGLRPWAHVTAASAAVAAGVTEAEAAAALEELVRRRMLEREEEEEGEEEGDGEGERRRYRFHDAWREYAQERALARDGAAGVAAALRKVLLWYVRAAAAADACVLPGRWHLGPAYARLEGRPAAYADGHSALEWLREERQNLAEAVRAAADYGLDEVTWQLCEAMWGLHLRLGFHQQWVGTHRLGVQAAARCAEECPEAEGRMRAQLGFAYMGLGDFARAQTEFEEAAAADRRAGHVRGEATAVESLGLLRLRQERWADAVDCLVTARELARQVGDPRALALLEHHLGRALQGAGRHEAAVAQLERARELMRALPDPYNEGRVLMSLGRALLEAGQGPAAEELLTEAAAVMAAEGAVIQQADVAELRALVARRAGDAEAEAGHLRAALAFHEATGAPGAVTVRARLEELGELEGRQSAGS
ncbi:tetratricopeptide repeat protein [Streptomyces sp. MST-110588]|uniref:tetratricopeptide repeat protein n=1 Tax=Streptomyces sp. MST-110588 TaxID=2833628 RepID=UPI002414212A|nr:tetratricopeptide repeat protein [Streptomyces sp. MST-110588]